MYEKKAVYFDRAAGAPWSAGAYGPEELDKLDRLFDYLGSFNGLSILEPGCGIGRLTEILSDRVGPRGQVLALDISPRMVESARERTKDRSNVQVLLAPVEAVPLAPAGYDLILCHQVFPHFENKARVLELLASTLKPQGKFIVFHFINFSEINDLHRKAGTAVEKDMMPSDDDMRRLFQESGMTVEFIRDDANGYFLSAKFQR